MPINNFSNLKEHLIRIVGSNDLSDILPDAIKTTEARMFANSREILKARPVETRSTATVSTTERYLALPDYFIDIRSLTWVLTGDDIELTYRTPNKLQEISTAGRPYRYTVTSQIEFERVPETAETIEIQFNAQIVPLDDTNTTNTILTNHPDIYINGCRWYLAEVNEELDNATYYESQFYKSIAGANAQYQAGRYGPAPTRRMNGCTP